MDLGSLSQQARKLAASQGRYAWDVHFRYWFRKRLVFFSTCGSVCYAHDIGLETVSVFFSAVVGVHRCVRERFVLAAHGSVCVGWGAVVQPTRAAQLIFQSRIAA